MSIYIEFFHGRTFPDEELDDWGFNGPIIGPFPFFHMTYLTHVKLGDGPEDSIEFVKDLIKFKGSYYGDISITDESRVDKKRLEKSKEILKTLPKDTTLLLNSEEQWIKNYICSLL